MSDAPAEGQPQAAPTAGSLLRQARQAQGMHIAMLAAATKVPQRKLEALEADRLDELPDATFTRALAQTVCRALKIDPAPVLALLPQPAGHRLEQVAEGINAPFRERPGMSQVGEGLNIGSPAVWAPLLVLLLAALVYFLPAGTVKLPGATGASAPTAARSASLPAAVATPAEAPAPAASVVVETVHSAPVAPEPAASGVASAASAPAPAAEAAPAGVLQLRTSAESWVEVTDARGATLLSRLLQPGETVGVDGATPMRLTVGNASATQVSFRGQPVTLTTTRDNVARMELK